MHLAIHTDGGARGNPGPAGAGVVLSDSQTGKALIEAGYFLGRCTNNVAEYHALLRGVALATSLEPQPESVTIHSDSELMVKQLNGQYKVKSADLKPLFDEARAALRKLPRATLVHIRRAANARADQLANLAMDRKADVLSPDLPTTAAAGSGGRASASTAGLFETAEGNNWWTATLTREPGKDCPSRCRAGVPYRFGPDTPAGFCVYAARAVLEHGPLSEQPRETIDCPRCNVPIRITLDSEA